MHNHLLHNQHDIAALQTHTTPILMEHCRNAFIVPLVVCRLMVPVDARFVMRGFMLLQVQNASRVLLAFTHLKELPIAKSVALEQFLTPLLPPAHLVQKACTPTLAAPNVLAAPVTTTDGGRALVPLSLVTFLVSLSMIT